MESTYVVPMTYEFYGQGSNESVLKEEPAPFRIDRDFEVIKIKRKQRKSDCYHI